MLFFVKTEVADGKVEELGRKIINQEFQPVEGNIVYVSKDGRCGYNLVEAKDEADVCAKFNSYDPYVKLVEVVPVETMGHFIERFKWENGLGRTTAGQGPSGGPSISPMR